MEGRQDTEIKTHKSQHMSFNLLHDLLIRERDILIDF